MKMHYGKIIDFRASRDSGIAQLVVVDRNGKTNAIPCDNAPTVAMLNRIFPGTIARGHEVDVSVLQGNEVYWSLDDMGLVLGGLSSKESIESRFGEALDEVEV